MSVFVIECFTYLAMGVMAIFSKWQILTMTSFVGLILVLSISFLAESNAKKWVPLVAVAQMLCGVALLVLIPAVMLADYIPVVVLYVLLGVCSLFVNAEFSGEGKPRIQRGK